MEGRYCPVYLMKTREDNNSMFHSEQRVRLLTDNKGVVTEAKENSADERAVSQKFSTCEIAVKRRYMKLWEQLKLLYTVYVDMNLLGQPTLFLLGVVPLYKGVVGLSVRTQVRVHRRSKTNHERKAR